MPGNTARAVRRRQNFALFSSLLIAAILAPLSFPLRAQDAPPPSYTYNGPKELNVMISHIVLYPDPLLSQMLAASTFPDEIPGAAQWAQGHRLLTGKDLAKAIEDDHLPWDGSVQSLLPFPGVLEMMARDITWTTDLGGAFLDQRGDLMDSIQEMRHRASAYGYLRSDSRVIVTSGVYVEILPTNPAMIPVPDYDFTAVFSPPPSWVGKNHAIAFGNSVKLGVPFRLWGWGISKFYWADHDVTTHRRAPRYDPEYRQENHKLAPAPDANEKPCAVCNPS